MKNITKPIKNFFLIVKNDVMETVQGTGRKIRQHVVSDLGFGAAMSMSVALTVRNLFAGLLSGLLFGALWWRYSRRQAY